MMRAFSRRAEFGHTKMLAEQQFLLITAPIGQTLQHMKLRRLAGTESQQSPSLVTHNLTSGFAGEPTHELFASPSEAQA